jgi:phage/plasmid-associated DNA primase
MDHLTLQPRPNKLHNITLSEKVNVNALTKLIHGSLLKSTVSKWKEFCFSSEKQQLTKYLSLINHGIATVNYKKSNDSLWGRSNPVNMVSLFAIRREIRHTIAGAYYTDIDIDNCHPQLLYQLCIQHNIPCEYLEKYVLNRKEYLDKVQAYYSVDYDSAKLLFIILLYGGGFAKWATEVNTNKPEMAFIKEFITEFHVIAEVIANVNPLIKVDVIERKTKYGKTDYNLSGTTLSIFLQELEVRILEEIYKYLTATNYVQNNNIVLCADGVMIESRNYKQELLADLSILIKDTFNFNLTFSVKPMNKRFTNELIEESMIYDLHTPEFTTGLLSDYFKILYDKFLFYDNKLYYFNGVYWECDHNMITIYNFIDKQFYGKLLHYYCKQRELIVKQYSLTDDAKDEMKRKLQPLEIFHKQISHLRQNKYRKTLTEDICNKLYDKTIVFNAKPNLFAFNNKIYDLACDAIIDPNPYDYISTTCGYNYNEHYDSCKIIEYSALLDTIFPNKANKEYYLECLATGLTGYQVENLFIATGQGGNGKGVINTQMMKTAGNYGYKLSSSVLLNEIKEGANPQIANLHQKRFALSTEPSDKKTMCSSTLKELTGDKTINARMAYSNKCDITLCLSLFLECNNLPKMDEVNDAVERRIRTIPFVSSFKSAEDYECTLDKTNVFIGNPRFKTDEFIEEHKQALFHLLSPLCKKFIQNGLVLSKVPAECKSAAIDYLVQSDHIYEWVCEKYEKTDKVDDFIYVKDMYEMFKSSSYFENLSKADKRKFTQKSFIENIKTNLFMKGNFKDRNIWVNSIKLTQAAIIGFNKQKMEQFLPQIEE